MRQLSAPGRLAVALAASLALAATAGCMSVSDDKSAEPAPGKSSDRRGAVAEHESAHGGSGGRHVRGGRGDSGASGDKGDAPDATPSPSGTAGPAARPPGGGDRPHPPGAPLPTGDGPTPSVQPTQPPEEPHTEPPVEPTTQPPVEPTDPPSASSAPEVHAGAMRLAYTDGPGVAWEPVASPQPGPVRRGAV
ncbi:hypothetical protein ACFYT4_27125 [Streptomyces sp. NPDC004609]|uniref:hypothetical protein n=1 Tax=Streptomyces sp. NPDC004609 TaxID=3364704 RepID=UPI0036AF1FCF